MTLDEYQEYATETRAPAGSFDRSVTIAALGLTGEAGEIADHIKKYLGQGHELARTAIIEELGDVLWYIVMMSDVLGVTLGEVAKYNLDKLGARYPHGFTTERSINRDA